MKFHHIAITGVGGISSLKVSFHPQMNLICGPNGVGKTTLLEAIAHIFAAGQSAILKRSVHVKAGQIIGHFKHLDEEPQSQTIDVAEFSPQKYSQTSGQHKLSRYLLSLKAARLFTYRALEAVGRDAERVNTYEEAKHGINLDDFKGWFANRYLYSAHGILSSSQVHNLDLAKRCFAILNGKFSFSRVDPRTNEILVNTPNGEIPYEYLSSGFKSTLAILFGIIKEIELRFPDGLAAEEFEGLVLIDEIELHLHPEWQARIASALTATFPKVQFIATTHSPHVIQFADPECVIALERLTDQSSVKLRELPDSPTGFKGWTVEEILTDVMGMDDLRTAIYSRTADSFGQAIAEENIALARDLFSQLDAMLHPQNRVRKLFRLQLASISGGEDDPTH